MDAQAKFEDGSYTSSQQVPRNSTDSTPAVKGKGRNPAKEEATTAKRRCVSTACIACRRRKSKCDGNLPKCAACASVYLTECEYAPHTDHRRKGVYKKDIDNLKTRNSTLQTLVQAILNYDEEDVPELVRQIRTCESLEDLAEAIVAKEKGLPNKAETPDSPIYGDDASLEVPQFEAELSGKMGDLLLEGSVRFIGGTSNLIWLPPGSEFQEKLSLPPNGREVVRPREEAVLSWTKVTKDKELILHLINMYFCWHYAYFTTLSKDLFYRDFLQGRYSEYCSSFLVNVMLALGCHFTSHPAARADPEDSATVGDHFFKEAKRVMYEDDEFTSAKLCTVQALALMSVREAGCGREGRGWVFSGMSFRMACDMGLNVDAPPISEASSFKDEDIDARRITFWGCFLFDKCWSNYLGRQPQLPLSNINVPKPEVFPSEDSELWSPYTDSGIVQALAQPARTRTVALQISKLSEISSDLLIYFYHPVQLDKPIGKQAELKKLSDLHTRLEAWKRDLSQELEPREGQLPQVLLMHMFFQLLFIHLYRPFLKYTRSTSPLPSHVSPRKFCTQAAGAISKLLRLYKRTHGLSQICNIAVYIAHSACTIHLLNIPDKNAKRDIVHGVKHLEEIGESWICARRTLRILSVSAEKWKIELPEEATATFTRTRAKWGTSEPAASPSGFSDVSVQSASQADTNVMEPTGMNQSTNHQTIINEHHSIPQNHNGIFPDMEPSPASSVPDTRRSSGVMSLPPQSAAELARMLTRNRPSTYLTKAQQDAWHAHQAARHNSAAHVESTNQPQNNASVLFGGVDSLVEESQDWWLKDQSALAMGFDNWVHPGMDWTQMGYPQVTSAMNGHNGAFPYVGEMQTDSTPYNPNMQHKVNGNSIPLQRGDSFEENNYY